MNTETRKQSLMKALATAVAILLTWPLANWAQSTSARSGSHLPWTKPTSSDSDKWVNRFPTTRDTITFILGANNVDGVRVAGTPQTIAAQTKFDHTGQIPRGRVITANRGVANGIDRGLLGSWVKSYGYSSSGIDIGHKTTHYVKFTSRVDGDLGNAQGAKWSGRSRANDPFHLLPDDFVHYTENWDLMLPVSLDRGTEFGMNGSVELSVFYDTADTTINLLSLFVDSSGVTAVSDEPLGLGLVLLDDLATDPTISAPDTITLEELRTLLESDMLADRTLDSPLYIGVVWEDIPVPTVDLGNGAVARIRVESEAADGQETNDISLQQGMDGYTDLRDLIIGRDIDQGEGNILGSDRFFEYLDGRYGDLHDRQGLLHFGEWEYLLPPGAKIIDATLEMTTSDAVDGNSSGPYGIARILHPFDQNTNFNNTGGGIRFHNGGSERPVPGGSEFAPFGRTRFDVTRLFHDPLLPFHGFVITSGSDDEWAPFWSGVAQDDPSLGPNLQIVFVDPDPLEAELEHTVLNIVDSDPENRMFFAHLNAAVIDDGAFANPQGESINGGANPTQVLFRFDRLFQSEGGPVPDRAQITRADLVINTASSQRNIDAGSSCRWDVRQIWDAWNAGSDPNTIQMDPQPVANVAGMIADAQATFDISEILARWQAGEPKEGIAVTDSNATDDWWVLPSSANPADAPRLLLEWVPVPSDVMILPESLNPVMGKGVEAHVRDLHTSDDSKVQMRRDQTALDAITTIEVVGYSSVSQPDGMEIVFEAAVFARSAVDQSIRLFNYQINDWENIDTRQASRFNDQLIIVSPAGDLSRFVQPETGQMQAQLEFKSRSRRQQFGSSVDTFGWLINPSAAF